MESFVIAKVIVVNPEGKILALRRSMTDTRRPGQWDFPGGFVEQGEELQAAARRETEEEAGIQLKNIQLCFGMSDPDPEHNRSGTWLVFVGHVAGTPDVTLSFEHDEYKWIDPAELRDEITYDRQQKMLDYLLANRLF
jgi:8-oxo-dGTP diphosphatase